MVIHKLVAIGKGTQIEFQEQYNSFSKTEGIEIRASTKDPIITNGQNGPFYVKGGEGDQVYEWCIYYEQKVQPVQQAKLVVPQFTPQ